MITTWGSIIQYLPCLPTPEFFYQMRPSYSRDSDRECLDGVDFERVGYEYAMSPALLLGAVAHGTFDKTKIARTPPASRLTDPAISDHLTVLGQLSDTERAGLWSPPTDWELTDLSFCTFCPYCCLADLANGRSPYGRRIWQQSWCTVSSLTGPH